MSRLDLSYVAASADITDEEIIRGFATLLGAMRARKIIRTRNVVGDLGERYAVNAYSSHKAKHPILLTQTNTADIDAIDSAGRSYSIKAVSPSSTRTSAFHLSKDGIESEKAFDYLVVVRVDDFMSPSDIIEFTWTQFWARKKWNGRQKAWFLPLTKAVLSS